MTTPKAKLAGLAIIAALCAGFTLGLTAPAWAGWDEGVAAYKRGDYATALREWRPLAEQGHGEAQFKLGVMYLNGHGVTRNSAEAWKWWRKAADQGHAGAQNVSGLLLGGMNYGEAAKWYRKAAEQGNTDGQNMLGFSYKLGAGVPRDYVMAHMWFNLSSAQGRKSAAKSRDALTKLMTPDQIAEAQRLAREWKPKQ